MLDIALLAHYTPPLETMNTEQLYNERLNRYTTAMRNEKPDRVPIRLLWLSSPLNTPVIPARKWCTIMRKLLPPPVSAPPIFDWDAVVANMVYV